MPGLWPRAWAPGPGPRAPGPGPWPPVLAPGPGPRALGPGPSDLCQAPSGESQRRNPINPKAEDRLKRLVGDGGGEARKERRQNNLHESFCLENSTKNFRETSWPTSWPTSLPPGLNFVGILVANFSWFGAHAPIIKSQIVCIIFCISRAPLHHQASHNTPPNAQCELRSHLSMGWAISRARGLGAEPRGRGGAGWGPGTFRRLGKLYVTYKLFRSP